MPSYKSSEPTSRPDFVEAGDYTVEVIGAEESISQKSHNELIELKLKVEPSGAILYDNLVFTANAFWKIDAFRAATGETVTPDEDIEIMADDLIGRRGRVRLIVDEYNGRKRNKVAAWLVPIATASTPPQTQRKTNRDEFAAISAVFHHEGDVLVAEDFEGFVIWIFHKRYGECLVSASHVPLAAGRGPRCVRARG